MTDVSRVGIVWVRRLRFAAMFVPLATVKCREKNFFEKKEVKSFLFQIKSVTLQTEKGVLCNFGTILKRKILKNNIIIKN